VATHCLEIILYLGVN